MSGASARRPRRRHEVTQVTGGERLCACAGSVSVGVPACRGESVRAGGGVRACARVGGESVRARVGSSSCSISQVVFSSLRLK